MIGLEFPGHRNRFLARVRRRYFSAEPSDSRKYVCVRTLYMSIHGYIWLYTAIYRYKWLYMAIHGYTWQYMAAHGYLTIRPVARKGYGSIAHEAKPNGLLTRGP